MPVEKLYVHLDKDNYSSTDTIWFKAYLLEGAYLQPSERSGICYLELINEQSKVLKRMKIPVKYGLGWGNLSLTDLAPSTGNYTLRAYTNWMLNFGEQAVFTTNVFVNNPRDDHPAAAGTQTDRLSIDLQFMPEGGKLIADVRTKVGFKAIGEDGRGIAVEGKIYNNKAEEVAVFKSAYKGIGVFELVPKKGETYRAKFHLTNGEVKDYPLPLVYDDGTVLNVIHQSGKSEISIAVSAKGSAKNIRGCFLIGQARGVVCYAVPVTLAKESITEVINKNIFPTGVVRFTLLSSNGEPLNERIIYIDHKDQLNVSVSAGSEKYSFRDSVALNVKVTDKHNAPVQGSFSLSVTDDQQVMINNTGKVGIATHLFLTSGLKGHVEEPEYYADTTTMAYQALDNLLLTQGWTGYDWKDVFNVKPVKYKAEPEFMITGKVSSVFKGIAAARVNLFGQHPLILRDTIAGPDGRFTFKSLPVSDTAAYKIQAYNKNGKGFLVTLEVDEWQPPVFNALPGNFNRTNLSNDAPLLQKISYTNELNTQSLRFAGKQLQEVNINAKKVVKKSYNLNGPGEADQVLNERDLQSEGKKALYDLLFQRVAGLKTGTYLFPPSSARKYGLMVKGKLLKIIMDGVDLDQTYHYYQTIDPGDSANEGMRERYLYMKDNLDHFTAEDITGIEVMHSSRFNAGYNQQFLSTAETVFSKNGLSTGIGGVSGVDYSYIEITTRSGKGPFMKQMPGTYLYKPLAFTLPKQFYRPRYPVKVADRTFLDIRSTVHWAPNIVTNEKGEATVSFYTADRPSTYSITIQGSDMDGRFGTLIKPGFIKVSP